MARGATNGKDMKRHMLGRPDHGSKKLVLGTWVSWQALLAKSRESRALSLQRQSGTLGSEIMWWEDARVACKMPRRQGLVGGTDSAFSILSNVSALSSPAPDPGTR